MSLKTATHLFFDMDGTLIDTLPPLYRAYSWVKERLQTVPSRDEFAALQGASMREIARVLAPTIDQISAIERELESAHSRFLPNSSQLFPGVEKFLQECQTRKLALWVVTSARQITANRLLGEVNALHFFEGIITSDRVSVGKPDPEIYLLALRSAGVNPEYVTVFEDSLQGITAALGAGLRVVAFTAESRILEPFSKHPNLIAHFSHWRDLGAWYLDQISHAS